MRDLKNITEAYQLGCVHFKPALQGRVPTSTESVIFPFDTEIIYNNNNNKAYRFHENSRHFCVEKGHYAQAKVMNVKLQISTLSA